MLWIVSLSSLLVSRPKKFSGYFVSGLYLFSFCYQLLRCRLHSEFDKKKNGGVLSQGDNYNCLLFQIHQSLFHGGVFCHRDIFKLGDFILPNRSIAFFQGSF